MKKTNLKQTTIEALTFKKVERSIRRNSDADDSVYKILEEMRVFMSDETWRSLPLYDAAEFVNRFITQTINFGTDDGQLEKLDALLFVLETANTLQLKHSKDPLPNELFRELEYRHSIGNQKSCLSRKKYE